MRGVVEPHTPDTEHGMLRGPDGRLYLFDHRHLVRRSKEPRNAAHVVFRQRDRRMVKARVVSYRRQGTWIAMVLEALLSVPMAMIES